MTEREYAAQARPFGQERGPRLVLLGLALFVVVALVKPWPDATTGRHPGSSPNAAATAAPPSIGPIATGRPTPTPGPNTMACLAGDVEQVVTLERTGSGRVQSWIPSLDRVAADPLALDLAPITVFSTHVVGIGVCAPDRGPSAAPSAGPDGSYGQAATVVDVQLLAAHGAPGPVDLGAPLALGGQSGATDDARLFGPRPVGGVLPPTAAPAGSAPGPAGPSSTPVAPADGPFWAAGSYAIGFTFPSDRPGAIRWVRVEFLPGAGSTG